MWREGGVTWCHTVLTPDPGLNTAVQMVLPHRYEFAVGLLLIAVWSVPLRDVGQGRGFVQSPTFHPPDTVAPDPWIPPRFGWDGYRGCQRCQQQQQGCLAVVQGTLQKSV